MAIFNKKSFSHFTERKSFATEKFSYACYIALLGMKLDLVRMKIESFWVVYSKHFIEFAQERHNEYLGKL